METEHQAEKNQEEAYQLLLTLAQIPAPSHQEEKRADFCRKWLADAGAKDVRIDEAKNVVFEWPDEQGNTDALTVFMAHSDVVFPDETSLPLHVRDGKIFCPGVGDNTAHVVALMMAVKSLIQADLHPKTGGFLFVIDAGEEGLGNLKGCRKIFEAYEGRIARFVALDICGTDIVTSAIGSRRFRVEMRTTGGHSFLNFGRENAIACLAEMIGKIYQMEIPKEGTTTYNVGTIEGGTTVNSIAASASMLCEFRSDQRTSMEVMQQQFDRIVKEMEREDLEISVMVVGDRPCTGNVNPEEMQRMVNLATPILAKHWKVQPKCVASSTDCNIPLSLGIPAICVGCALGEYEHTREEYVTIMSLLPGQKIASELIAAFL